MDCSELILELYGP